VLLVPSGVNHVRTVVENPGGPQGPWPTLSTESQPVVPGVPIDMEIVTDPNLHLVRAGGLGGGLVHYLAGPGPAVIPSTTGDPAIDGSAVSVVDVTGPAPSRALCRQLLRSAGQG